MLTSFLLGVNLLLMSYIYWYTQSLFHYVCLTLLDLKRLARFCSSRKEGRNMLPSRSLLLHLNKKAISCVLGNKYFYYLLSSSLLSFSAFPPLPSRVPYLPPISLCNMLILWISDNISTTIRVVLWLVDLSSIPRRIKRLNIGSVKI